MLVRLRGKVVPGGLMFYCGCFFFHREISEFPPPIDVKLCHVIGSIFNL